MTVPNLTANNDTIDIVTTTGRDSSQGFTFSIKRESATMWSARVKMNGTTYWHRGISLHTYAGNSVSVAVEIDWAEDGESVQVRVYYNGVENTASGTYPIETDTGLDYNTSSATGHTPEKMLTFGSFNPSLNSADGGTVNSVANNSVKNYDIKINYIVIVEGLEGLNLFKIFS